MIASQQSAWLTELRTQNYPFWVIVAGIELRVSAAWRGHKQNQTRTTEKDPQPITGNYHPERVVLSLQFGSVRRFIQTGVPVPQRLGERPGILIKPDRP